MSSPSLNNSLNGLAWILLTIGSLLKAKKPIIDALAVP